MNETNNNKISCTCRAEHVCDRCKLWLRWRAITRAWRSSVRGVGTPGDWLAGAEIETKQQSLF